jgi:hypothetical protein
MPILRYPRTLLAGAAIGLLVACGSDTVTSPTFGSTCHAGTLRPGDTITVEFTESSCFMEFDFWSYRHAPFISYTVDLTQGHAYMIRLDSIPNAIDTTGDMDARLTLWGVNADGASIPLAASDDDAGHLNSVIWFVAPVTGNFQLVASGYEHDALGAYRLTMNECPILGVLDTAGTYNFTLATSPCILPRAGGSPIDTSRYSMLSLNADPGDSISIQVTTGAFPPVWDIFGPGFDTYSKIYNDTRWTDARGTNATTGFALAQTGGLISIGIGGTTKDSTTGAFTLVLGRTPAPVAPPGAGPWSIARLPLMTRKPAPTKQR